VRHSEAGDDEATSRGPTDGPARNQGDGGGGTVGLHALAPAVQERATFRPRIVVTIQIAATV
jgi:hypothetical protein